MCPKNERCAKRLGERNVRNVKTFQKSTLHIFPKGKKRSFKYLLPLKLRAAHLSGKRQT